MPPEVHWCSISVRNGPSEATAQRVLLLSTVGVLVLHSSKVMKKELACRASSYYFSACFMLSPLRNTALAKVLHTIPDTSYDDARSEFVKIYPGYAPKGITDFLRAKWNELWNKLSNELVENINEQAQVYPVCVSFTHIGISKNMV